ncbi:radical SAM protein [Paenibacillus sp. WC2504]|uniref:radical SAM protein n=1 Tax=Paenibacillus sp. WC2504 TaxID=3461403 RepID=UPI004045B18B
MSVNPLSKAQLYQMLSPKVQEFILLPTEQCNFRCTYCYENFEKGRMSKETIEAFKQLLATRMPELKHLTLSWFGGEPLVAKDIVMDISSYALELSQKYNVDFHAGMTTNAYMLNNELFKALLEVGVNAYQISLDGFGEVHDQTRKRADGKGTFNRIWKNLLDIRDSDQKFTIKLRIHLDYDKVSNIEPLIRELREHFVDDPRFTIMLKPLAKLGGKNDANMDVISRQDESTILEELYLRLYGHKVEHEFLKDYVCYAAKPNSLIIRSDGSLGKCTVALNDSRNAIGQLLSNGTIQVNQQLLQNWTRGISNNDRSELACPLASLPDTLLMSGI